MKRFDQILRAFTAKHTKLIFFAKSENTQSILEEFRDYIIQSRLKMLENIFLVSKLNIYLLLSHYFNNSRQEKIRIFSRSDFFTLVPIFESLESTSCEFYLATLASRVIRSVFPTVNKPIKSGKKFILSRLPTGLSNTKKE